MVKIVQGDCLQILDSFAPDTFDGVVTDPPYSSGGMTKDARAQATSKKYTATKANCPYPDFEGDNKDGRSWTNWMAEWMSKARLCSKPGAPIVVFTDWRQLPSMTDALQWAGWIWRGVVVWDKATARPQKGRYRQQCEFVVWGSNGHMPITRNAPITPGIYRYAMPAKRQHQTQKPLELMRDLLKIVEPGGHVLEPFAGSGTTLEAAELEGYRATGIELSKPYFEIARQRV